MTGGNNNMGFFGELKQDLSQAVNELMPNEEFRTESTGQNGRSLGEMLENIDDISIPEYEDDVGEQTVESDGEETFGPGIVDDIVDAVTFSEPDTETSEEAAKESADDDTSDQESMIEDAPTEPVVSESKGEKKIVDTFSGTRGIVDETTVITVGMTITGDISSEGSVDLVGNVNGNIDILGKLNVTGHINGNSKASEVYADGAKISGEIVSEGAVRIGASTVIIGNITASSAVIAGAVKGDIDVKGPVILDTSAIVMGNIKSKSVQINNGAVIEGMCTQCYADISPTAFFEDYKPEIKKSQTSK